MSNQTQQDNDHSYKEDMYEDNNNKCKLNKIPLQLKEMHQSKKLHNSIKQLTQL